MKKYGLVASLFAVLMVCVGFSSARASTYQSSPTGDNVTVDKVVDTHAIYASGNVVTLSTEAPSDFFAVAATVNVQKKVDGSVYATASDISITAPVVHAARLAGSHLTITGDIGEDVSAVGSELTIARDTIVHGDVHFVGSTLTINGHITGNIVAAGSVIIINGTVDGNLTFNATTITVADTASVGGFLHYRSANDATLAPGVVRGAITHTPSTTKNWPNVPGFMLFVLSMLVSGVVFIVLARNKIKRVVHHRKTMPLADFAVGLALIFLSPIPIALLFASLIGIPLALILLALYGIMLYVASVITCIFVGLVAMDAVKLKSTEQMRPYAGLVVGIVVTILIRAIPFIGGLVMFILMSYVLGLQARYDIDLWHKLRHNEDL